MRYSSTAVFERRNVTNAFLMLTGFEGGTGSWMIESLRHLQCGKFDKDIQLLSKCTAKHVARQLSCRRRYSYSLLDMVLHVRMPVLKILTKSRLFKNCTYCKSRKTTSSLSEQAWYFLSY